MYSKKTKKRSNLLRLHRAFMALLEIVKVPP
jgi:hypothetical protein